VSVRSFKTHTFCFNAFKQLSIYQMTTFSILINLFVTPPRLLDYTMTWFWRDKASHT